MYGLNFNFDDMERKVNVTATLTFLMDGKPIRLSHQMTLTQLTNQLRCDLSRAGQPLPDFPQYERLASRDTDACRLTYRIDNRDCYRILGTGVVCYFYAGRLQSVYMDSQATDKYNVGPK